MPREIRYRGRRVDNGEWLIGCLIIDPDMQQYMICGFDYYNGETGLEREPFQHEVDPKTVGQYTGLKDRNGKEIYEGDIVNVKSWNMNGVVNYTSGMFKVQDTYRDTNPSLASFQSELRCEVIGNIHEHPHLLKGEEQ